jgi:hypothetical protein
MLTLTRAEMLGCEDFVVSVCLLKLKTAVIAFEFVYRLKFPSLGTLAFLLSDVK